MTNINNLLNYLPTYFLFDDVKALDPSRPDSSIRRWINTLASRRKINRLRAPASNRKAIYSKR